MLLSREIDINKTVLHHTKQMSPVQRATAVEQSTYTHTERNENKFIVLPIEEDYMRWWWNWSIGRQSETCLCHDLSTSGCSPEFWRTKKATDEEWKRRTNARKSIWVLKGQHFLRAVFHRCGYSTSSNSLAFSPHWYRFSDAIRRFL